MTTFVTPELAGTVGLWLGLLISLSIFSLVAGDNGLARLAQYILVGAGLAYATVLAWRSVLMPRLFLPLQDAPALWSLWVPLVLGLLLLAAGLERSWRTPMQAESGWRRGLHLLGSLPLALMMGVAIAAGMVGVVQGTLLPQFTRAVLTGFPWRGPPAILINGVIGLLVTTGVIVYLRSRPSLLEQQPGGLRALLRGWAWIGQRGLWLATGLIFARLLAARLSLLIAEFEFVAARVQQTGIWQLGERLWQQLP